MDHKTPLRLSEPIESRLVEVARLLIDQRAARIIVPPRQQASGYWFGGGNLTMDSDGALLLVGRYRNAGDSRTGLQAGERGLELALFRSTDQGQTFTKTLAFSKADLNLDDREVLSIEGSAIRVAGDQVELFVSTEKSNVGYPVGFEDYLKPGTGVWTIDRLVARSVGDLSAARPETILQSADPCHLHLKDPAVYETPTGDLSLLFCTHPYCWSSSNTAYAVRRAGAAEFSPPRFDCFPRGPAWDVAICRGTAVVNLPALGVLAGLDVQLLFYDGGESLRNLDEHAAAVRRPRGYSCEELGGVGYLLNGDWSRFFRLSRVRPLFISPFGSGCSRYVDVLGTPRGYYATWQQSQPDGSQPLVMHSVDRSRLEAVLTR